MAVRLAVDNAERGLDEVSPERQRHDDDLRRFVGMFEEAEQSFQPAREKAERDRDYYDNKQWTEDEAAKLRARGQPVIAFNLIRGRINYQLGMEKKQRRDPKAFGRGPSDAQAAEVATEALRYAMDRTDYHSERSRVWENIKIEGMGALECTMVQRPDGNSDVKMKAIPWDRFFYDPHSARPDFSDARYLGQIKWMDEAELLEQYPDASLALDTTLTGDVVGLGETYEDRPRWQMWADPKRKRVRVVQLYYRERGEWHWCEFVRGGILDAGPSPYVDDQGETLCGIIAESCYVDRENNRYGEVRDLVDPQDEVNKRRSKSLHLLNTKTVRARTGAVADKEAARREIARPDGWVEIQGGNIDEALKIDTNTDLAAGQAAMGAEAMAHIMRTGPNAALLGKGTESQSGRAIQAQQQGGLIELGDGLDVLRRLDHRAFKFVWCALRQYWQAPMWIRVTEDPEAPRWIGLNQLDPMTGQPSNVPAMMDVDIMIEDAPDVTTLEGENFAATTEILTQSGGDPTTMMFLAEIHPGLKSAQRKKLRAFAEQRMQMAAQAAQAAAANEQAKTQADILAKKSKSETDKGRLDLDALEAGARIAEQASRPDPKPAASGPPS